MVLDVRHHGGDRLERHAERDETRVGERVLRGLRAGREQRLAVAEHGLAPAMPDRALAFERDVEPQVVIVQLRARALGARLGAGESDEAQARQGAHRAVDIERAVGGGIEAVAQECAPGGGKPVEIAHRAAAVAVRTRAHRKADHVGIAGIRRAAHLPPPATSIMWLGRRRRACGSSAHVWRDLALPMVTGLLSAAPARGPPAARRRSACGTRRGNVTDG